MNIIIVLKSFVALATALTGLLALVRPTMIYGFTGLTAQGARGISEIRAIFGGLFIALGSVPFFIGTPAYLVLGAGYLAIAAVRLVSILIDRSRDRSNLISLAIEIVFGIILIMEI